jgi:hypothetical protein
MSVMPGPSLEDCRQWLKAAFAEAEAGLKEGGLPIGSVIVDPENGEIISRGKKEFELSGLKIFPLASSKILCTCISYNIAL